MSDPDVVVESNVPSRAPDLAIIQGPDERWFVQRVSDRLAGWLDLGDLEVAGHDLLEVFADVSPRIDSLAEEATYHGVALKGVAIHFQGRDSLELIADIAPGGVNDKGARQVFCRFRLPAVGLTRRHEPAGRYGLVGNSPGMQEVFRKIDLYADADASVIIAGETGTGKELVARALHEQGARRGGAFVAVNCSAISAELLESELFGHEKGAFTGALKTHKGRFERADHGTIFLDEVGDMPESAQVKLLRILEEGVLERVGSEKPVQVDVRVLAATNVPMERAVQQGVFRSDLYHRLAVLRVHLPALRQRSDDIPLLVDYFLSLFSRRYGRTVERLTPEALRLLQAYLWPGNVRELRNVLERVFVESHTNVIGARAFREWVQERQDFPPGDWGSSSMVGESGTMVLPYPLAQERVLLSRPERLALGPPEAEAPVKTSRTTRPVNLDEANIRNAWKVADGNLAAAARALGVHRATLYRYMKKLNLNRDSLDK